MTGNRFVPSPVRPRSLHSVQSISLPSAALVVARHPELWGTGLRQMWRLRRTGWWRRPPFLPVPGRDYLAFRMTTAYGDEPSGDASHDLVTYLRWCKAWPHLAR